MRTQALLASAVALITAACALHVSASSAVAGGTKQAAATAVKPHLLQSREERQLIIKERQLNIDFYDDDRDECYNEVTDKFEKCDLDRFPNCKSNELICYNRTNRRDKFYGDHHPYFFINYNRVMCYPASWEGWGGCSSCSPGRYCRHEKRCILDEGSYCCEGEWGCNKGGGEAEKI